MDSGHGALELQRRRRAQLSLNARQIGELCTELTSLLKGLELRELAPLPPRDLLLVFEVSEGGPIRRLLLSCDQNASRLHLVQSRLDRGKHPLGPFYGQLVKELDGAKLHSVEQVAGDRIVWIEFRTTDGGRRTLCCELTGRHANLVLLDEKDEVLSVLVPPPKNVQGGARLEAGKPWRGPGGTPPPHSELPSLEETYPDPPEADGRIYAPLSWLVESGLGNEAHDRREDSLRSKLLQRLRRKDKRIRSKLAGLEKRLAAVDQSQTLQQDGELLKANLHNIKRGMKSIIVQDWFDDAGGERKIQLEAKLTPQDNLERIFTRYKKLLRAAESIPEERAEAQARADRISAFLTRAEDTTSDPEEVDREAVKAGILDPMQIADPRKKKAPAKRIAYKTFFSARGSEIRVGRSARDNDELSFRKCRGKDIWLHTADAPGSHVVLCLEGRPEAEEEELLDALHLAAHFSPLKDSPKVQIHVARCNQVHKPRGAKPGLVSLSGGRNIMVRVQPSRIRGLLAQRRPPSDSA